MNTFFDNHTHSEYSNIRLLDCINKPKDLVDRAMQLGLAGITITDHECLSSHVKFNQIAKSLQDISPDFTIALGNEIYLTDDRSNGQKYYHFILIAKDAIGHHQLRELSSIAWINSYYDRGMERVPLLKSELYEVVSKDPGHLIATSACISGELGTSILNLTKCENVGDKATASFYAQQITNFITYAKDLFQDDFYLELAPAASKEQIIVNKRIESIAHSFNIKMSIGSDSHYLSKEDRYVHKAYLNSKGGEREVDAFYEYAYLHSAEEAKEHLLKSLSEETIEQVFANSLEIKSKITFFDLAKNQEITEVPVTDYPKGNAKVNNYPVLSALNNSENIQERYWVNECVNTLKEKNLYNDTYLARLEEEADTKKTIGEKLGTCMFAYPNTLKHYVDLFWECGSLVGAGRGSSCSGLNHWLLGITQLDPIKWNLPWFRYMNKDRTEIGDIDLDLCPSKRPKILQEIKKEREQYFDAGVAAQFRHNLGVTLIATFGTETTKSAILTACRGYQTAEYPNGIDTDEAQYLSSLVPQERGFLWSLSDVVKGNPEKGRKPVQQFIAAVSKYPRLLDVMTSIEGLINKRSSHASGVILFEKDPFDRGCFMKTPKGEIITQYNLHDAEYGGLTKYDFLVTEVSDKIVETINLLQADGVIEQDLSLREVYNKYLHPEVLPLDDHKIWEALHNGSVLNVFQFDSIEGAKAAKKIKPSNILELSDANGLMRLMTSEKGTELPMDKYVRYKNNISLWYAEMDKAGLTKEEQHTLEPYFKSSYGVPPSQEQLMLMLMDKDICNFSLAEANNARKIVGKKQMDKIPTLKQEVLTRATSPKLGEYVWRSGVEPQLGYSFSMIHALAYSMIGAQTLYLATYWNPIYWNTACLIVNSGSLEDNSEEELVDIYEPEQDDLANGVTFVDLPDRKGKIRKTASTDYSKIAKAIGDIRQAGIIISCVDINESNFGFKPDVKNNRILYGLKGLSNISDDFISTIVSNRPYTSLYDFYKRVNPTRTAMINLIKGGAFDCFEPRARAMVEYLWLSCDKKKRLTLQNMAGLIKYDMIPQEEELLNAKKIFEFNRYLKNECKGNTENFKIDNRAIEFLNSFNYEYLITEITSAENGNLLCAMLNKKLWDKEYQKWMNTFRDWIAADKDNLLNELNTKIFMEDWNKYATGNISAWEMEALCFYYHDHELKDVDINKYGLVDFFKMSREPEVDRVFRRGDVVIPTYKLVKICGTCIAKNKTKSMVYLLTTSGVVSVKFSKEYFAMFDRQISEYQADGTKKIVEKSWFNRGNKIMVQGFRREDEFVGKRYNSTPGHQLYHIDAVYEDGSLELRHERVQGDLDNG